MTAGARRGQDGVERPAVRRGRTARVSLLLASGLAAAMLGAGVAGSAQAGDASSGAAGAIQAGDASAGAPQAGAAAPGAKPEQAPAGAATGASPGTVPAGAKAAEGPPGAAARVGDETIPLSEVEERAAGDLAQIEQERQRILERALDDLVAERLLAAEARKRGVSVDRLVRDEVTAKVPAITEADVDAFIARNRHRLPPQNDEASLRPRVADHLRRQAVARRRAAFVAGLRAGIPVQVYLKEPEPVRASVDPTVGFARGPKEAPVSIVEFSDFQCPFCQRAVETVKDLTTVYRDQVRWVFRDFPIEGLHPEAPLAHEAARCAGEQDRFWAYHDLLFERAPHLEPARLRDYAKEVGLDVAAFGSCLDSHRHRAAVDADIETGQRLGVTGTPTFFINGVPLVGNQPPAAFQKVIDRELARRAR